MSARRSLLFLSPCTPDAQGVGWEKRAHSLLLAYSRFMDVDLWLRPSPDQPDLRRLAPLAPLCRSITAFYASALNEESSGLKARLVAQLTAADAVHVFRLQEFVLSINHRCMVWDIDEIPWMLRSTGNNREAPAIPADRLAKAAAAFAQCVGKCRLVIACSALERPAGCAAFAVIPNVVSHPPSAQAPRGEDDGGLLFVGNLNHLPNLDGLLYLEDRILPILDRIVPPVPVLVVGRSPAGEEARATVAHLQRRGRLRFEFDVPDCTPFYERATASIAPIRMGGGTRLKIVESFAHRCPVVSTAKGCEGMEVTHGEQLLIADDPEHFARACAELLRSPSLRREIADSAFRHYERRQSQPVVDELLASVTEKLLDADG
jgi:glycosyltransferase involved in cell wall biosynthesis